MIHQRTIQDLIKIMQSDGIFIYPTDTVWGLGCDALNPLAVQRIYNTKKRSKSKGLILLVDSIEMLHQYVDKIHPRLETLLSYHMRPLTVIYDSPKNLPPYLIHSDGTAAIRVTQDPFCKELIKAWAGPIVSTSANISEQTAPSKYDQISSELLEKVDYVVDSVDLSDDRQPSMIIKVDEDGEIAFLRN